MSEEEWADGSQSERMGLATALVTGMTLSIGCSPDFDDLHAEIAIEKPNVLGCSAQFEGD